MSKIINQYKNVAHIGSYTVVGTQSIFIAAKAIKKLQVSTIEQALFNSNKKVSLTIEEKTLKIWQQDFYRESH